MRVDKTIRETSFLFLINDRPSIKPTAIRTESGKSMRNKREAWLPPAMVRLLATGMRKSQLRMKREDGFFRFLPTRIKPANKNGAKTTRSCPKRLTDWRKFGSPEIKRNSVENEVR